MIIGNKSFSSLTAKQKVKFSEELIKFASDEANLIKKIKSIHSSLNKHIESLKINNAREKLRDLIRSETFFIEVRKSYIPKSPII